jgi:RNA polymerase sigma-70 factor (ECF subfamily)
MPEAASESMAGQLFADEPRPSSAAVRAEIKQRLHAALDGMDATDREVLVLRHFEHLSTSEAARSLGISEAAAGKRYLRALARLREVLAGLPGGLEP